MNTFLKTHGKWILAVLGVVLMISWGYGGSNKNDKSSVRTIGTFGKTKVTSDEVQNAGGAANILRRLAYLQFQQLSQSVYLQLYSAGAIPPHADPQRVASYVGQLTVERYGPHPERNDPGESCFRVMALLGTGESAGNRYGMLSAKQPDLHYLLLTKEAQAKGIAVSSPDAQDFVQRFEFSADTLAQLKIEFQIGESNFAAVIHQYLAVEQLINLAGDAVQVSLPEVEHVLVDTQSTVTAAYIALTIHADDLKSVPIPSDDQINKHFALYKDVLPPNPKKPPAAIAGHDYPFGYKFPDRIALEFLTIPYAEVRKTSEPKNDQEKIEDQIQAYKMFLADDEIDRVPPEARPGSATAPATTSAATAAATAPATSATTAPATIAATTTAPSTTVATTTTPATTPATSTAPAILYTPEQRWDAARSYYLAKQVDKRALSKVRELADRAVAKGLAPWKEIADTGYRADLRHDITSIAKGVVTTKTPFSSAFLPGQSFHFSELVAPAGIDAATPYTVDQILSPNTFTFKGPANADTTAASATSAAIIIPMIPYTQIADELSKAAGVPVVAHAATRLITAEQIPSIPGIGKAAYTRPSREQVLLQDIAMHVYPLEEKQTGVPLQLLTQVNVEGPVLFDDDNNAYIYRVTEAEKSHTPATADELAEIRPTIVRDLQSLSAYESLKTQGADLQLAAQVSGLKVVAANRMRELHITPPFARIGVSRSASGQLEYTTPPIDEKLGVIPAFTTAAFDLAFKIGHPTQGAVSQPSWAPPPPAGPAVTVPVDNTLTVFVLAVDNYDPVPSNAIDKERLQLPAQLATARRTAFIQEWITLKQTALRNHYKPADGYDLEKE